MTLYMYKRPSGIFQLNYVLVTKFSCRNFIFSNIFALFLPNASASGVTNETENASSMFGEGANDLIHVQTIK
jgi:hypothetical protein